jgi:hypothetical protein
MGLYAAGTRLRAQVRTWAVGCESNDASRARVRTRSEWLTECYRMLCVCRRGCSFQSAAYFLAGSLHVTASSMGPRSADMPVPMLTIAASESRRHGIAWTTHCEACHSVLQSERQHRAPLHDRHTTSMQTTSACTAMQTVGIIAEAPGRQAPPVPGTDLAHANRPLLAW